MTAKAIPSTTYRVHAYGSGDGGSQLVEQWLNTLPGRVVSVFWWGADGLFAVTEQVPA